eukprot:1006106-Pleurochrysis_carterae.AAC.1
MGHTLNPKRFSLTMSCYLETPLWLPLHPFPTPPSCLPSADPGFSGTYFRYVLRGSTVAKLRFGPCFLCDAGVTTGSTCAPCGTEVADGSLPASLESESHAPDRTNATSLGCVPGSATYPACLDTDAVGCNSECEETVCFKSSCRRCGNVTDS